MSIVDWLSTTNWAPFGPSPIDAPGVGLGLAAGRIEAAAPHPSDPDVMYVAGNNGGVWKTGVWGNDPPVWLVFGDAEQSLNFAGYHPLLVHPANHNLVLGAVCGHGAGVLKSTNGGLSWQLLGNGTFEGAAIGSLAVDPTSTNTLYVSAWYGGPGGGVYKSTDGGQNWTNTTSSVHAGAVTDVIVARFDPKTLYAGMVAWYGAGAATAGVYKSSDGGGTWKLMSGLPSGSGLANAVRLESASTTGVVYASCFVSQSGNTVVQRFKTTDGGKTWKQLAATPGSPETRSWHLLLGVDPANDKHVFANDAYVLYESTDGGKTWTQAESIGDDWVNIAFEAKGNTVVTADRDVYRYDPKARTWKSKEGNLQVTLFYDIALDPTNPDIVYGVAQDHPLAMKFGGTIEWSYMPAGGETGKVLVDPTNTSRLYVSNPLDPTHFVARSTNDGQTWKTIFAASDFAASDYSLAYSVQRSFAIDPTKPARLLIGTTRVWQTTNATAASPTWKAISGILGGAKVSQQYITALAIAPSDPKTIYAATADGHVWATTDGGANWAARDSNMFGMGGGKIVDIRIDPENPNRAFAVGAGQGSVWYLDTVGGSLQWTNISGDLPSYLRSGTIFADWRFATPALYLGTSRGAYHSVNMGAHWSVFGLDLPNTVVSDLESATQDVLVAATIGRGAWAILAPSSSISGKITLPLEPGVVHPGDPVEGVTIILDAGGGVREHMPTAVTNARGRYFFEKVPPGTYTVRRIAPPGYMDPCDGPVRITVQGSDVCDLDFHYRFSPELARASGPYGWAADLNTLPGRQPSQPIAGREEEEEPAPRRARKRAPRRKALLAVK